MAPLEARLDLRHCVFSVARQWRKMTAPLLDFPYSKNSAAQSAPLLVCQWRTSSKLRVLRLRGNRRQHGYAAAQQETVMP